jgi:hypothetical protein
VRHLGRNEEEFDSKFVTYLLLQFLTKVRGEMIFFNPGQHFAASYECASSIAANGFWLSSPGDETLDGVEPGGHCQIGACLDVDCSSGEACEEQTPNLSASSDHEGPKVIHASFAEDS